MSPLLFESVLAAAKEAEEWAWTEIYNWLALPLGGYFRLRGLNDPDDLVGEVFAQIARNLGSFEGHADGFRSWVFMIAHNRLANERRRSRRKPQTLTADVDAVDRRRSPSAEELAMSRIESDRVAFLLEGLTDHQRDVLALRVVAGFSLQETAQITGRSVGSVKQLQRRGLEDLRTRFVAEGVTK
jgi:RNA polymerase sigma-70 factor (ECF subfamily)